MDLLNRLADKVNFTFEVHLSEDGSYGSLRRVSNAQFKSCRKKNVLLVSQASKWWFEAVDKAKRYSLEPVVCLVEFGLQANRFQFKY